MGELENEMWEVRGDIKKCANEWITIEDNWGPIHWDPERNFEVHASELSSQGTRKLVCISTDPSKPSPGARASTEKQEAISMCGDSLKRYLGLEGQRF